MATLIAHGIGQSSDTYTTSTNASLDTAGADLLVMWVGNYGRLYGTGEVYDVVDGSGNTWLAGEDYHTPGSEIFGRFFYSFNPAHTGTGHTFVAHHALISYPMIEVWAYSGARTASDPLDQQTGHGAYATWLVNAGPISPTTDNQIVITAVVTGAVNTYTIAGGGFSTPTDSITNNGTTGLGGAGAALVQTTRTTSNPAWSFPEGDQGFIVVAMITFQTVESGGPTDRALGQPAVASSEYPGGGYEAGLAVDGDGGTRWASAVENPAWWYVDLGVRYDVTGVTITWESAYATDYLVRVSDGGGIWTTIATLSGRTGGVEILSVSGTGRYVGFYGISGPFTNYSFWSFEVFGTATSEPPAPTTIDIPAGSLTFTGTYPRRAGAEPPGQTLLFTGYAPTLYIHTVGAPPTPQPPYPFVRSGICRANANSAGWTPPNITFRIAGVDRIANLVGADNFVLTQQADGTPATLTFTVRNLVPQVGQHVELFFAPPNEYLFAGTLLQADAMSVDDDAGVFWHCTAVGLQWLADRYDLVLARYQSTGANVIVADILARCANGGFRVGYVPASLGNLTMDFTFETVVAALSRVAKAAKAFVEILPFDGQSRIVNLYASYPAAAPAIVTNAKATLSTFGYAPDLTQARTRSIGRGRGSSVTVVTAAGSSTIPVDDLSPFSETGGQATAAFSRLNYTGVATVFAVDGTHQHYLTGVTGLIDDLMSGDTVDVLVTTIDAAATAALATRLGGGLSGQATNYFADGRISAEEIVKRAATDLAVFSTPLEDLTWRYIAIQRGLHVGRSVTVSIAKPIPVSGSFLMQTIQWTPYGVVGGTLLELQQTVTATRYVRTMVDLLATLPG